MQGRFALFASAAVILTSGGVKPALAQDAAAQTTPPATASTVAAKAAPAKAGVEEVLVTATKRSTRLQKTPIAVTAISAATLEKQHVSTIEDVVHLVPGFQATSEGDHGVITLTERGIGNDAAKTEYADPEVALFVDGVYSPRAEGAAALLFDMASIEVLRGPQGTLWGRNSTAGAVNMQTAKPSFAGIFGSIQAGGGDYDRFGVRGFVNVPLSDTLAVRVAYAKEEHDGYTEYQDPVLPSLASQRAAALAAGLPPASFQPINPNLFVTSGPKYNAQDQDALRASALWRPIEDFSWNLSFEYFRDRGTPDANLLQDPRPGTQLFSALIDTAPYLHRDVFTVRSRMDYQINDYLALDYIAGYSDYRGQSDFDQDGGTHVPTSYATGAIFQEDRTNWSRYVSYSHELELKSTGVHMIDWILGLYYEHEDNGIRFDIPIFNGTQQGTVNWQGSFIQPKETVDSKAVFGQATYNFNPWLHLTGGLRYTEDNRGNDGGTNNGWTGNPNVPQVPLAPYENPLNVGFATYQFNSGSYESSKVTYLARLSADVTDNFLAYASISSGYKSGGLQDGGLHYQPETLTNYEIGTKNRLFGGLVTFNNAAFYEDFQGFQYAAPVTFSDGSHGLAFSNAGGDTIVYGLESEIAARPTPDDTVQLSLSLMHSALGILPAAGSNDYSNLPKCVADPRISNCVDATGNTLPHAPTFSMQLIYEHVFLLPNDATITPRISTHFETQSWLSILHDGPGDQQGAYTRTDLDITYRSPGRKHYEAEFYVQNLENGYIRTDALATSDNIYTSQFLPPRTFGFNLKYDF
jgi:iron complex outermembrane recepter protein